MEPLAALHAPLLWMSAALAVGCVVGRGSPLMWVSVAVVALVLARSRLDPRVRLAAWMLCVLLAGGAMRAAVEARADERVQQIAVLLKEPRVRFEAVVERVLRQDLLPRIQVHVVKAHAGSTVTPLDVHAVLNLPAVMVPPHEGSTVLFVAPLGPPRTTRFPGDFDAGRSLAARGIELAGSVSHPTNIAVLEGPDPLTRLQRAITDARAHTRALIRTHLPDDAAALTEAFVLGDSALMTDELRLPFDAAGAAHLLAVSGLQATLLAMLLFTLLRFLWGRSRRLLRRADPGPAAALLCLPAIFLYASYAGGAASVMRSAWMASAVMVAQVVRRKGALAQVLGAAAFIMLLVEPRAVHDAGFLLSFLSVLALGVVAPGLSRAMQVPDDEGVRRFMLAGLAASTAAYIATLPLVVHLFGRIAVWGAFTNVILIPVGAIALPIVVVAALLATLMGSPLLIQIAGAVSIAVLELCRLFAALPAALIEVPPPSLWFVSLALVGALVAGVGTRRTMYGGLGLVVIGVLGGFAPSSSHTNVVRILMAPVGQGDGAIVIAPTGEAIVIDAGGSFISDVDPGRTVMAPILRSLGITQLQAMVLSHPHPDHQNGLVTLVEEFRPKELWYSGQPSRHPRFLALMHELQRVGVPVKHFDRGVDGAFPEQRIGGVTFTILHPLPPRPVDDPEAPRFFPEFSENDNSLVVKISFGNSHALFPGDIEEDAERMLTLDEKTRSKLRAQLLKIPHHGSITSTSAALLDAVEPAHVLIGVGVRNPWGFPHPDVLERLSERRIQVWRTDEDGLITAVLDGNSVTVSAHRR